MGSLRSAGSSSGKSSVGRASWPSSVAITMSMVSCGTNSRIPAEIFSWRWEGSFRPPRIELMPAWISASSGSHGQKPGPWYCPTRSGASPARRLVAPASPSIMATL